MFVQLRSIFQRILSTTWVGHLLFWVCYYLYDGPIASTIEVVPYKRICSAAIGLPVKITATYVTLYLLTRYLREQPRNRRLLYLLFLSVIGFGICARLVSYEIVYPNFYQEWATMQPLWYAPKIIMETFGVYSVVALVATMHFIKQWYVSQKEKQVYQHEKLEAELKYLKGQIHPHFLFNTLNNLYALTIDQSRKAPEVVYKLSELMSYMLYESNKPFVPLQKEIAYIENYIVLEKIRYEDRLDVSLNVLSDISGYLIAPLLILPFVENSFKHGFSNDIGNIWVHIDILVNDAQLIIKIENSKCEPPLEKPVHCGIGLTNVKKRLDLIYKDQYSLQIFDEESYLVILKIAI